MLLTLLNSKIGDLLTINGKNHFKVKVDKALLKKQANCIQPKNKFEMIEIFKDLKLLYNNYWIVLLIIDKLINAIVILIFIALKWLVKKLHIQILFKLVCSHFYKILHSPLLFNNGWRLHTGFNAYLAKLIFISSS